MQTPADSERIRLLLADDHVLMLESLARLLAAEPGFQLVAACAAAPEALQVLSHTTVHVVLTRLGIAGDLVSTARQAGYRGKVLILAAEIDTAAAITALRGGASGIFLESDSLGRLTQAIRLVADGEAWVSQKVIQFLATQRPQQQVSPWGLLSEREGKVLQGVVEGLTNRTIGSRIGTSESAIKATLQQLFRKAGVRTRSQLVCLVMEASRGTQISAWTGVGDPADGVSAG